MSKLWREPTPIRVEEAGERPAVLHLNGQRHRVQRIETRWRVDETLGVMLFQEQVLKVAMAVAGFSPGQADALRRAMSRARSKQAIEALRPAFLQGAQARGIDADVAHTIFDQIAGYAGYGFCKSHAASFALIAYATCWLKSLL